MTAAIEVRALQKRFGSLQALDRIDLCVQPGEFFGLLGPNGAGKTSLISILAGLSRADAGTARILGKDVVRDYRAARRLLGVVPQELVFDPFFSVREVLRLQAGYFGLSGVDDWIDEILHSLDLTDKAETNLRRLSGGMKRRVLVAQALVHRPPVIILDEPTAGVDVELRQGLWAFVGRLNRQGHTVLLTTHYLEEAEALCGRIAMMRAGRIIDLDHTANLLQRYTTQEVSLRLTAELPESLAALCVAREGQRWRLRVDNPEAVEGVLRSLREANVGIEELDVSKPRLEEVFVQRMRESSAS